LLLHALLFQAVSLGSAVRKSRAPDEETGPGASAIVSGANMSMTLVLIQLPGITHSDPLEELASRGFAPANAAIQVVSPNPAPAFDGQEMSTEQDADADVTAGDPAVRSMLFGRYTGQINARIERAWRRPRSPVIEQTAMDSSSGMAGSPSSEGHLFRCVARITQDIRGNVKEIELLRCNGSRAWQQSLVDAIQVASPLPAPPARAIFTNVLTMSFEARAYRPGLTDDGYEAAGNPTVLARAVANAPGTPSHAAAPRLEPDSSLSRYYAPVDVQSERAPEPQ
jgi:hypothetical protein